MEVPHLKSHKLKANSPEQREVILKAFLSQRQKIPRKTSLCRFYLRGLCIFKDQQCPYAHSIQSLNYKPYQGQQIQYDYLGTDFNQRPLLLQQRNYISLFQYQSIILQKDPSFKSYSLQEINDPKDACPRKAIRKIMHNDMYQSFLELIGKVYPQAIMTQSFLEREYTRVGFNKTMTRIKFGFLLKFIEKTHFKTQFVMPPHLKAKRTFLFPLPPFSDIKQFYQQQLVQFLLINKRPKETEIRRRLYQCFDVSIPPINQFLKLSGLDFKQFLRQSSKNKQIRRSLNADDEQPLFQMQESQENLSAQIKDKIIDLKVPVTTMTQIKEIASKLYQSCSNKTKKLKEVIKEVLLLLIKDGIQVYYHNMFTLVYLPIYSSKQIIFHCCKCPHRAKASPVVFRKLNPQDIVYRQQRTILVQDFQSISYAQSSLDRQQIVGVDLQGWLSPKGYIQLIQISINISGRKQILVFDFITLASNSCLQEARLVLKALFQDPLIKKVFHDSRNDSLAIHKFVESCIVNIFDTSISHLLIQQMGRYPLSGDAKSLLQEMMVIRHPGLNLILEKYKAPNGINTLKEKYHQMFHSKVKFTNRPIDPQYLEYSVRDVQDLQDVYRYMNKLIDPNLSACGSAHFAAEGWSALNEQ